MTGETGATSAAAVCDNQVSLGKSKDFGFAFDKRDGGKTQPTKTTTTKTTH